MRRMRLLRLTFSLRGMSIISSAPQLPTAVPNKTASDWKELARRPGDFCPLPGLTFLKIEIVWSRSSTLNRVAEPSSDQRARPCAPANSPPARPHAIGGREVAPKRRARITIESNGGEDEDRNISGRQFYLGRMSISIGHVHSTGIRLSEGYEDERGIFEGCH